MNKPKINPVDRHVGMRLRIIRNSQNKTLEEIAAKLKITPKTLNDLESGKKRVTPAEMEIIVEIFSTTVSFFFIGIGNHLDKPRN